jgi:hypothetical protein
MILGNVSALNCPQRLDQFGHGPEGRIPHERGPATTRLVVVLGRVEEPGDLIG